MECHSIVDLSEIVAENHVSRERGSDFDLSDTLRSAILTYTPCSNSER